MSEGIQTRRWTRAEYDRLIEIGVFQPGDRVELLGGELIVAEPQSEPHYTAIGLTEDALRAALGAGWVVRTQGPIALDDESEPEPDVAVVPGSFRDYLSAHPSRPVIIVEVSESSLRLDRRQKAGVYARAGVADYWIVNLVDETVEVLRRPEPDPSTQFGWRYFDAETFRAGAAISPLARPDVTIAVADLLP